MRILIVEDEFKIADASHELKTPIASLFLQMLMYQ